MSPREIIDWTLTASGWDGLERLEQERWFDVQPGFDTAHFIDGFGHADGRWHFDVDWTALGAGGFCPAATVASMPSLPDHWSSIEEATADYPFRLVTAPARHFLNSSFNQTPSSLRRERSPCVLLHPDDAAALGVADGDTVSVHNPRGTLELRAECFDGLQRGVVVIESVWANKAFRGGLGANVLTGADAGAPNGGAVFHDNRAAIAPLAGAAS